MQSQQAPPRKPAKQWSRISGASPNWSLHLRIRASAPPLLLGSNEGPQQWILEACLSSLRVRLTKAPRTRLHLAAAHREIGAGRHWVSLGGPLLHLVHVDS